MRFYVPAALALLPLLILSEAAPACSLCGGLNQRTLRQEMEQAQLVVYGILANPRPSSDPQRPGGTTELHVLRVLKDHPARAGRTVLVLDRYLPVLDARQPPRFLVFCDVVQGKIDPYRGRPVASEAVLDYLAGMPKPAGGDRRALLHYCFPFLDHVDALIAEDAYLEFARSSDREVGEVGRQLDPGRLRRLLRDPQTPAPRLSLYAFLLGACGTPADAELLRSLLHQEDARAAAAREGLLCGYLALRRAEGWKLLQQLLAEPQRPLVERLAALRAVRVWYNWQPQQDRPQLLQTLALAVRDGTLADLAVEELRQTQIWDLTDLVLEQYGRPSHASPLVRRAIARYALCCPLPAAQHFVAHLRRQEPELVHDLEEALRFERRSTSASPAAVSSPE